MPEGGDLAITNRRLVYLGIHRTVEWPYRQIIRVENQPEKAGITSELITERLVGFGYRSQSATLLHMRDRSHVSGIQYLTADADLVRLRMDFGVAVGTNKRREFAERLRAELAAL